MFVYTLTGFDSRVTKDIDFLVRNLSNDLSTIETVMAKICDEQFKASLITLTVLSSERIAIEKKYPGVRIKLMGRIGNVRVPFSVDVGIDDVVFPLPKKRKITTRLPDFVSPEIYTYSLESAVAEKLDAILQRMETTSRMKDFYDIYYLSKVFDFDGETLSKAIQATLSHRKRVLNPEAFDEILEFGKNPVMTNRWKAFEPAQNPTLDFNEVLKEIAIFLEPVYHAVLKEDPFVLAWNHEQGAWNPR